MDADVSAHLHLCSIGRGKTNCFIAKYPDKLQILA
jgi:hypothetical protein